MNPENRSEVNDRLSAEWSSAIIEARTRLHSAGDARGVVESIRFSSRLVRAAEVLEDWPAHHDANHVRLNGFAKAARMMLAGDESISVKFQPESWGKNLEVNFSDIDGEDVTLMAGSAKMQQKLYLREWKKIFEAEPIKMVEGSRKYQLDKIEGHYSEGGLAITRKVGRGGLIVGALGTLSTPRCGLTKAVLDIDTEQYAVDLDEWYRVRGTDVKVKLVPQMEEDLVRVKFFFDCPRSVKIIREELLFGR